MTLVTSKWYTLFLQGDKRVTMVLQTIGVRKHLLFPFIAAGGEHHRYKYRKRAA